MSRKGMNKVPVNSEIIRLLIDVRDTSIRQLGPAIGYSEKTIRRGLKDEKMSFDLVMRLGKELRVHPSKFADFYAYFGTYNGSFD